MTCYTRIDLDAYAHREAADMRKETGQSAKVQYWYIMIGDNQCSLAVVIRTPTGAQTRYIAI